MVMLVIGVGAIYCWNSSNKTEPAVEESSTSESSSVKESALPAKSSPEHSGVPSNITVSPVPSSGVSANAQEDFSKKTATELAPDQQTLRKEAEKDPERVPPSTLFFAARLGKKMETALKSEEGASSLFQELQGCVTSQRLEGSVTSQTLCLQDAQELAEAYPGKLKDQYAALFDRAEPRVRSLLVPARH